MSAKGAEGGGGGSAGGVKPPEPLNQKKKLFSSKEKMDEKNMSHKGLGGGVPDQTTKKTHSNRVKPLLELMESS